MVLGPLNAQYYDAKLQGPFDKTTAKVKTVRKKIKYIQNHFDFILNCQIKKGNP